MNVTCVWVMAAASIGTLPSSKGTLEPGRGAPVLTVPAPGADRIVALVVSLQQPGHLEPSATVAASVRLADSTLNKTLHLGDPDVTWLVRQPAGAEARVTLVADRSHPAPLHYAVSASELGETADGVAFEAEPNDRYQDANALILGRTVYGLADDRAYLPRGDTPTSAEMAPAPDWFTFEFASNTPKLAFFGIDYVDKDVPPDVRLYTLRDGKLVEYTNGIDPQSLQRERPPRLGANKFTTRVLTSGRYYLLVDACQPEYQLRTKLFDVPPYLTRERADAATPADRAAAAARAVRVAMDFQLLAGDSWHANTPRKGHPMDRVANPHQETFDLPGLPRDAFHHPVGDGGRAGRIQGRAAVRPAIPDRTPGEQPHAVPRLPRRPLGSNDPRAGERDGAALDDPDRLREPGRRGPSRQPAPGCLGVPEALLRRPQDAPAR